MKSSKKAINEGTQLDIDKAISLEEKIFGECFGTKDQIELMEHLTNYTVPEEDNNYDIAARDELLSKADDLSKKPQRKI